MIRRLLIVGLVLALGSTVSSAGMMTTGVGPGSAGGGVFVPSFLLIQTGSVMLIQTGSKLEIHQ